MNDMELTRQRQEHQKKYGIQKGFPVHVIILGNKNAKVFFTITALERYKSRLERHKIKYNYKLVHVNDVKYVEYEI